MTERYRINRVALTLRGVDRSDAMQVVARLREELARELKSAGGRLDTPTRSSHLPEVALRMVGPASDPTGRETARRVSRAIGDAIVSSASTVKKRGG